MRGPQSLDSFSAVLTRLARRLGLETLLLEHRLQREWREIAGEPLAANSWPDQIKYKKLYLLVRNNIWMHQLTFLKPALLERLAAVAGPGFIADIVLRVGELPQQNPISSSHPPAQETQVSAPEAALLAEAEAHSSVIRDRELRERLAQLMAQSLTGPTGSTAGRQAP